MYRDKFEYTTSKVFATIPRASETDLEDFSGSLEHIYPLGNYRSLSPVSYMFRLVFLKGLIVRRSQKKKNFEVSKVLKAFKGSFTCHL